MKRVVATTLVSIMLLNLMPIEVLAENIKIPPKSQIGTMTIKLEGGPKAISLDTRRTGLLDEGSFLLNAEGEARAEIQSVYYDGQKLTEISLAGTSFNMYPVANNFPEKEEIIDVIENEIKSLDELIEKESKKDCINENKDFNKGYVWTIVK